MLEVFTVGAASISSTPSTPSLPGRGRGYRSLLRVVMVMGLIYSLLVVAFTLNFRAWMNWFLQATAIYLCLMVPTIDVKVTDRINPSLAPATVANVPLGLGVLASFTTQIGDWLTRTAETVFVMPASSTTRPTAWSTARGCSTRPATS
jgi:conjugal transfer mating pair stabilization protein TraG